MRAHRRVHTSRRRAALLALAAALVFAFVVVVAFSGRLPGQDGFELRAALPSATQVKKGNAVRVAGLDVGVVTGLEPGPGRTTEIQMRIDRPEMLRADATIEVRPRLLLEGNAAVHVQPGTPGAAPLRDGARIPAERTAAAVQLDQVISALDSPIRGALSATVHELSGALAPGPRGGRSGARGLRAASKELARMLPGFTGTVAAMRGSAPGDLPGLVVSSRDTVAQLATDPRRLADLVTDFNRVFGTLARETAALRSTLRSMGSVLRSARDPLTSLEQSLPALRAFGSLAEPALRAAPDALEETASLLDQVNAVVRQPELPLLLERLEPVVRSLPALQRSLTETFPLVAAAGSCIARNVLPTLNRELPDGRLSTGRPAWQDMLHMAAALTGTSPGFDGNGGTLRISIAEGGNAGRAVLPGLGPLVSSSNLEGVNPHWLGYGVTPQFRPDAPCTAQQLPDLAARTSPGLPAEWEVTARPRLDETQASRQARMLELLFSGRGSDRRELRRLLLDRYAPAQTASSARTADVPAASDRGMRSEDAAPEATLLDSPPAAQPRVGALAHPAPTMGDAVRKLLGEGGSP